MNKTEMSKAHKSDKMRLITHEEAAFEEQDSKYETNSCARRCKVLLFYGVLIGMMIVLCYLTLLGWQSYTKLLGSDRSAPVFNINGIPSLQNADVMDDIEEYPLHSIKENVYKRKKKSVHIENVIHSNKDNLDRMKYNLPHNEENTLLDENMQENSNDFAEIVEKMIEDEQIISETKDPRHMNIQKAEQYVNKQNKFNHEKYENEDKFIVNEDLLEKIIENEQISSKTKEKNTDFESDIKTTIKNSMHRIYHITGRNRNLSIWIYCSIILVCGIVLMIVITLCINFFYKIIIVKMMSKHRRLKEEQEYEIQKRLDPLSLPPVTPGTPIDKDLRFTIKREKIDMFCDIYD